MDFMYLTNGFFEVLGEHLMELLENGGNIIKTYVAASSIFLGGVGIETGIAYSYALTMDNLEYNPDNFLRQEDGLVKTLEEEFSKTIKGVFGTTLK